MDLPHADSPLDPLPDFSSYASLVEKGFEVPVNSPAFDRKIRSERRLHEFGVATLAWLPTIEDEAEAVQRLPQEVARRAVCTMAVAVKAESVLAGAWGKKKATPRSSRDRLRPSWPFQPK
jgi:hypothetical protein